MALKREIPATQRERDSGMAIGRLIRCPVLRTLRPSGQQMFQTRARRYSTSAAPAGLPTAASPTAILGGLTSELDRIAPRFDIQASQIRILRTPTEFYETLKVSGTQNFSPGQPESRRLM